MAEELEDILENLFPSQNPDEVPQTFKPINTKEQLIIKTVLLSALWVRCPIQDKKRALMISLLSTNVYKNETFFMGKTQITSVFNLIDCEKLTKPINAADVEKVLVPNYLSLDLQLIPIHNDTAKILLSR
ncbi:MAG: hypothetical protein IPN94_11545 [Sphingobacteriales bacterium]|nr:hypothetical protein [Sphingobacteriales bacterium]